MKPKLFVALLSIALAFAFSGAVSAANFDFQISPSIISACSCSAITPQNVQISVTNLYQYPDTYSFTIDAPAGFSSSVQQDLVINSGETRKLDLFLINTGCSVIPGDYKVTIKAKSGTTGEIQTKTLDIEVLNCYEVAVSLDSKYRDMCTEEGTTTMFYMNIKNNGKYTDTYDLTSSVSWALFSESSVTLDPGKTKSVAIALSPPAGARGLQLINVQAKSRQHSVSDSDTIQLNVQDCYSVTADLQPTDSSICLGSSASQKLTITNTGLKADNYTVSIPSWVTADRTFASLQPKASVSINLTLKPAQQGKTSYNISVFSAKVASLTRTFASSISAQECKGVAVIISPSQTNVCQGVSSDFIVFVKNLGTVQDTFTLTTTSGTLEVTKVVVNAGDSKQVKLSLANATSGNYTIRVKAQSGTVSDQSEVQASVQNCYSTSMDIGPQNFSACFNAKVNYTVAVKNTGKLLDSYTLAFENAYSNETRAFTLNPNDVRIEEFVITVPQNPTAGNYPVKATLVSTNTRSTVQTNLIVKPKDSCYSVQITSPDEVQVPICNASSLPVTIKNTGEKKDTYSVSISGPEWAYVSPNAVTLNGGQQQQVYLYFSPCYGAQLQGYSLRVKVSSPTVQIQKTLSIDVSNSTSTVSPPPVITPGDNGTGSNQSGGNNTITGLILGLDSNTWKVVAIALITIIIIIILAIRFILLAKK